jgi:hypothetical protein
VRASSALETRVIEQLRHSLKSTNSTPMPPERLIHSHELGSESNVCKREREICAGSFYECGWLSFLPGILEMPNLGFQVKDYFRFSGDRNKRSLLY